MCPGLDLTAPAHTHTQPAARHTTFNLRERREEAHTRWRGPDNNKEIGLTGLFSGEISQGNTKWRTNEEWMDARMEEWCEKVRIPDSRDGVWVWFSLMCQDGSSHLSFSDSLLILSLLSFVFFFITPFPWFFLCLPLPRSSLLPCFCLSFFYRYLFSFIFYLSLMNTLNIHWPFLSCVVLLLNTRLT